MNLKIKNIEVNLKDDKKIIVKKADFFLKEGEIISLNGKNGSGKSSLFSALFKHPNFEIKKGEFFLEDENQNINLLEKETFEIVKYGLYLSMQHVPEIEGVNLLQFLYRAYKNINPENTLSVLDFNKSLIEFSEKYEISPEFLKRDLNVGFSGGEKKQAEMLHLFALKPKFVFMDEIDSGVDKEAIKKVFKIINAFNKEYKTAFCIISHKENLHEYLKEDRIYEMKEGVLEEVK